MPVRVPLAVPSAPPTTAPTGPPVAAPLAAPTASPDTAPDTGFEYPGDRIGMQTLLWYLWPGAQGYFAIAALDVAARMAATTARTLFASLSPRKMQRSAEAPRRGVNAGQSNRVPRVAATRFLASIGLLPREFG